MPIESIGDLSLVETIYEKRDRIAYITLNRERAGNSFNVQMCDEMEAIWTDFRDDDDTFGLPFSRPPVRSSSAPEWTSRSPVPVRWGMSGCRLPG